MLNVGKTDEEKIYIEKLEIDMYKLFTTN